MGRSGMEHIGPIALSDGPKRTNASTGQKTFPKTERPWGSDGRPAWVASSAARAGRDCCDDLLRAPQYIGRERAQEVVVRRSVSAVTFAAQPARMGPVPRRGREGKCHRVYD